MNECGIYPLYPVFIRSGLGAGVLRRTGMGEFVEFIGTWRSLSGYFL